MKPCEEILILILADLSQDYRCFKVAMTLQKLGYSPTVLCDQPLHSLGSGWKDVHIRVLTRHSHYLSFITVWLTYLMRITPILIKTKSPVWIVEDGAPLLWAATIGKLRGKRVIYDAREILLETPMIRSRPSRRLLWALWLGAGMNLIGRVITVSPLFLQYYRTRYPKKKFLLLPNVPTCSLQQDFEKPSVTYKVRLIYQGALRAGSGLQEVLNAMAMASEYELSIYGSGTEEVLLRKLSESLGLTDRVTFHGTIPFENLGEPIGVSHIGLHLLEPSFLSYDFTLSNKIFDYIHRLTPVLLGSTAAHHALIKDEPIGVIPNSRSPIEILGALATLRTHYSTFQESCRAARTRWVWDAYEAEFAKIIADSPAGQTISQ